MPIQENPLALVRALRGAPLTCLVALRLAGGPAAVRRVCEITGYSPKTASAALLALAELELATHDGQHSQWQLTPAAGNLLPSPSGDLAPAGPRRALETAGGQPAAAASRSSRQVGGKISRSGGKSYASAMQAIAKAYPSSISLSIIKRESALTTNRTGRPARPLPGPGREAVRKILAATRDLFGERVLGRPSQYPDVQLLLGWIAQAYDRRDRLRKPARVVYAGLKNLEEPEARYLRDPWAFLPDDFRERVGEDPDEAGPQDEAQAEDWDGAGGAGTEPDGELAFDPLDEADDEPDEDLPVESDSVRLAANPAGTLTARQAWEIALDLLRREMPRSAFEQHVRDAVLVDYDPVSGTFRAAAGNDYLRRWLKDRLTSTLVRMLCGICNRQVEVEFVVVGPGG